MEDGVWSQIEVNTLVLVCGLNIGLATRTKRPMTHPWCTHCICGGMGKCSNTATVEVDSSTATTPSASAI